MPWVCATCTVHNEDSRTMCSVCGTDKPRSSSRTSRPSSTASRPSSRARPTSRGSRPSSRASRTSSRTSTRSSSRSRTREKPKPKGPTWECSQCSLQNDLARTMCAACQSDKPKKIPAGRTASPPANNTAALAFLTNLGINESRALEALALKGGDKDRALEWLIDGPSAKPPPTSSAPVAMDTRMDTGRSSPPAAQTAEPGTRGGGSRTSSTPSTRSTASPARVSKAEKAARERVRKEEEQQQQRRVLALEKLQQEEAAKAAHLRTQGVEARKAATKQLLVQKEEERRRKDLAEHKKELAAEAERTAAKQARKEKRRAAEAALTDIDSALAHIHEHYGVYRLQLTMARIRKIISKLLAHPTEPKYRTLNLASDHLQKPLVRPLGALFILRQVGFVEENNKMVLAKVEEGRLLNALEIFDHHKIETSSNVCDLWAQIDDRVKVDVVYYVTLEVRNILFNVVTMPTEPNFRSVDTTASSYRKIKKLPPAFKLLCDLGFTPPPVGHIYMTVEDPDIARFEAVVHDLNKELAKRVNDTAVCKGVRRLLKTNKLSLTTAFIDMFRACLHRIEAHPGEQKFYNINLPKFLGKVSKTGGGKPFAGGEDFLQMFGFKVDGDTAALPFGSYDKEWLQYRRRDLTRVWRDVQKKADTRRLALEAREIAAKQELRARNRADEEEEKSDDDEDME